MPRVSFGNHASIITLYKLGMSQRKISLCVGISKSTVQRTIKRYSTCSIIQDKPKSGRPKKLSKRNERNIVYRSKMDPSKTANQIRSDLNLSLSVSVDTIKRCLRSNNLHGRIMMNVELCYFQMLEDMLEDQKNVEMRKNIHQKL
ncbi:uncharacterized protein LOC115231854 [Octopus sinensis]|uniref:Uncharacterized protein LOC115231854 n=1 Tax=Octopus sinensis TaxID=2607531 RepID=A0A6P7U8B9_9MOLL|nr:uncharacterized protein LOC115231854 [Octopus sinensis]